MTLQKILEAIGSTFACTGYGPRGPWMLMFRPPRYPARGERR
jgi:hypothetical protein